VGGSQVLVGNETKDKVANFGALEAMSPETAQTRTKAWFDSVVKNDAAKSQEFGRIWAQTDRSVLERVTDSITLADATAHKLMAQARDPLAPAPTEVPEYFKDNKANAFVRANLALAYARTLSNRRVHDEALDTLKTIKPEQVVDPATYLFHRAVCEHAMLLKPEAAKSIGRLIADSVDAPERYKIVGTLILLDMQTWKDKDLAAISRKMKVVEDRLQLARGGDKTQKIQKDIVARLDELIKELENKAKKQQQGGG
jgi:hypothetical protein